MGGGGLYKLVFQQKGPLLITPISSTENKKIKKVPFFLKNRGPHYSSS